MAEKDTETIKNEFLDYIWSQISLFTTKEKYKKLSDNEKLEMLAFSILSMLDGASTVLPAFRVAPNPHPDDKKDRMENNEDYYPENEGAELKGDISGELHDHFFPRKPGNLHA